MMVTRSFLLFLLLPAPAASSEHPDSSASLYPLDEIVVTATRSAALRSSVSSAVSVLDPARLSLTPGTQLSAALATTPGVSLKEYGGNAAVRTISLRGVGTENVLVLVDGERYNSIQNGGVDFGLLPLGAVERVEIVRGGQSGLYGADAVGGIVNVATRRPGGRFGAGVETTVGGFGFSSMDAYAEGTAGPGLWRLAGRRERGAGNYGFDFDEPGRSERLIRKGADFRMDRLDGRVELRPSEELQVDAQGAWMDADRGSPGPVTDPASAGRARLYDRVLTARTGVRWQADETITTRASVGFRYGDERYVDPLTLLGGAPTDSRTISRSFTFQPSMKWTPSGSTSLSLDGELARAWMSGSETRDALRWIGGVTIGGQHVFEIPGGTPAEIIVYPSLRYDRISDAGGDLSGRLGINAGLLQAPMLRVRASYGRNFRAPTFNELYWISGGNPGLKPERSLSGDVGLTFLSNAGGELIVDLTAFWISSRDRIVWLPATGTYWSPRNIGRVTSSGIEAEARWQGFGGLLELAANSSWMTAKKTSSDYPGDPTEGRILVYSPRQTATIQITFRLMPVEVSVQNLWTSYRYTTAANDEFLPAHSVTSAAMQTRFPLFGAALRLKLELLNMFDEQYSSIALFPMPGREFRGTCGVEL